MKLLSEFLIFLIKSIILGIGTIMLLGGGVCSVVDVVAFGDSHNREQPLIMVGLILMSLFVSFAGYHLRRSVLTNKENKIMNFLQKIQYQQPISFDETMTFIAAHYDYQPTEFSNGLGEDKLMSPAGINQGSCKIFAFAQLHNLTAEQTLNLFGDYYHIEVLQNPNGTDHQNIRLFMKYGWDGIVFQNQALTDKK
jgi:hypothetical protein